jgi:two-component system chemotaxis response regulator CheY
MPSSHHSPPKRSLRVLYVDDQEILRSFVAAYLRHFGHEVETACDGLEGWEKFRQAVYDMVITDLEMPNLDGIGFIRRLRESNTRVRIIVHSAAFNPGNLAELRKLAVDGLLAKGSPALALRDAVEKVGGAEPDPPRT